MRILLAVDGSRSSDRARDLVAALPTHEGSSVRIVSVVPTATDPISMGWAPMADPGVDVVDASALRTHIDALDAAEREIRSARSDLVIETVLVRGRAASRIVEEACSMPADLVVVGHRGHGRWESILLGSVSAEVVDHAPCPVLVARDERIGPIILADDRSAHARAAEAFMTSWPLFEGLPVTVVTVDEDGFPYSPSVPPLVYSEAMDAYAYGTAAQRRATEADCEAAAMRLRQAGLAADAEVREGDPAHEIVLSARHHGAGLVVMGTRGQTGLRRLVLGSVARKVLLHAPCSVLIVRGGPHVTGPLPGTRREPEAVSPFG
ncbi:MAG TPA: universal stress protein [Candidatus Limnocylindrales bacterium]|jgi:nucleotide-binding universal stress UspA family protein|nr:universal stress protein [Candidatus Limnocylindrales bacterium]